MEKFREILNAFDASDALLGEQIDKLNTEVENKVNIIDLKNHMSVTSLKLTSSGWYRFFVYNSDSQSSARAAMGYAPTFSLFRDYWDSNNEIHKIDLLGVYNTFKFINENSVGNALLVSKIRCVVTSTLSYIDLYYNSNATNRVTGTVMNADSSGGDIDRMFWEAIKQPYKVEETASDETVASTFTFTQNRTIESRLAALEAKVGI